MRDDRTQCPSSGRAGARTAEVHPALHIGRASAFPQCCICMSVVPPCEHQHVPRHAIGPRPGGAWGISLLRPSGVSRQSCHTLVSISRLQRGRWSYSSLYLFNRP